MNAKAATFYLLSISCLPLLWHQGRQVRKHTLRLPPPQGERIGSVGSGVPFHVLVLGDSAAEGVGTDTQETALLGQLMSELSTSLPNRQIHYQLIANTGDTTADIIAHLEQHLTATTCLTDLDMVIISAGVNDVTTLTRINKWKTQIRCLIRILKDDLHAKHIIFTAVPPMQHFPALPSPLKQWLGLRAQMLNHHLVSLCTTNEVDFLALQLSFHPEYMARDGFHPSSTTYTHWAKAAIKCLVHLPEALSRT